MGEVRLFHLRYLFSKFEEKLTLYDKSIKKILDIEDISSVRIGCNYLYNKNFRY